MQKKPDGPSTSTGRGALSDPQLPPAGGGVDSKPTATPRSLRQSSANAPRTWEAATEAGREPHLKRGTARPAGAPRGRGPCGPAAAPPAPRTRPVHDGNRIRPLPEKSRFQCSTLLFFQRQYFYDVIQSGACSAVVRLGRAVGCCASAQNPSAPHVAATALLACSRRRTPQPRPARHRHLVGPYPASPSPPAPAHPATTVLFSASVSWFLPQRDFLKHVLIFQKHTQKPTKTRDALSRPPSSEH